MLPVSKSDEDGEEAEGNIQLQVWRLPPSQYPKRPFHPTNRHTLQPRRVTDLQIVSVYRQDRNQEGVDYLEIVRNNAVNLQRSKNQYEFTLSTLN